jgi:hypothetical protein
MIYLSAAHLEMEHINGAGISYNALKLLQLWAQQEEFAPEALRAHNILAVLFK